MKKLILLLCFFISIASVAVALPLEKTESNAIQINKKIRTDKDTKIIKVAFRKDFKESYNSSAFDYKLKTQEKSIWDKFTDWLTYWLNKIFGGFNTKNSINSANLILKIVAILIILFVIYQITKSIINKEGSWIFGKSSKKKVIHHEDIEKNLKNVDFKKLVADTINAGNHRLAVRYYYLWTLKQMSEKGIIEWIPEKTNTDYLYEIKSAQLKNEFEYLSYLYNYIWYGEFEMTIERFEDVKKSFDQTIRLI